jgi:hypothetical protein
MKKSFTPTFSYKSFLLPVVSRAANLLSSGNYDAAINKAVSNLRTNKETKGKQDYIYLLKKLLQKEERDLNAI